MPIPKPNTNESKADFVQRCMVDRVMVSEYENTDQRLAICSTTYEELKQDTSKETKRETGK
jgi:hypothetical protein